MSLLDILEANKALLVKIENLSDGAFNDGISGNSLGYAYSDMFDELYKDLRDIQFALHKYVAGVTKDA